jgi:hypothetical protein
MRDHHDHGNPPPDVKDFVETVLGVGGAVLTAHGAWVASLGLVGKVGLALGLVSFPVGLGVAAGVLAATPLLVKTARYVHARRGAQRP